MSSEIYIFLSTMLTGQNMELLWSIYLRENNALINSQLINLATRNPYYNIPDYIEIEEKYGVKSTFFFRTIYENGHFSDYEDDIQSLIRGGWEIGLHTHPQSIKCLEKLQNEKKQLELITKHSISANRVHYLNNDVELASRLHSLGFIYDSSVKHCKDRVTMDDMGFYEIGNLIEFPVTIMDAYIFTYMKIKESQVLAFFERTLNRTKDVKKRYYNSYLA